MSDIVERLRDAGDGWSGDAFCVAAEVADEAADEITALRARIAELEASIADQREDAARAALREAQRLSGFSMHNIDPKQFRTPT